MSREVSAFATSRNCNASIACIATIESVATLHIRELPEEVHGALKRLAGSEGISMEALARRLLSEAVRKPRARKPASVQALVRRLYGGKLPGSVVEEFLSARREDSQDE